MPGARKEKGPRRPPLRLAPRHYRTSWERRERKREIERERDARTEEREGGVARERREMPPGREREEERVKVRVTI